LISPKKKREIHEGGRRRRKVDHLARGRSVISFTQQREIDVVQIAKLRNTKRDVSIQECDTLRERRDVKTHLIRQGKKATGKKKASAPDRRKAT